MREREHGKYFWTDVDIIETYTISAKEIETDKWRYYVYFSLVNREESSSEEKGKEINRRAKNKFDLVHFQILLIWDTINLF